MDVDRGLLNPKFDGYRLDPVDDQDVLLRFALPLDHLPTQATLSPRATSSFHQVQSRIRHNHLAPGPAHTALYVDLNLNIVLVHLEPTSPTFTVVHQLPRPVRDGSEGDRLQRENPSAVYVGPSTWFVADGYGTFCAFDLPPPYGPALPVAKHALPQETEESVPVPFRIHAAAHTEPGTATLVLSSACRQPNPSGTARTAKLVQFDIRAVRVPLPTGDSSDASSSRPLDVVWHRRGSAVPIYVAYDSSRASWLLVGECVYRPPSEPSEEDRAPAEDERAPIPRANESLDAAPVPPPPPPPYSWTQTSDSVTVAFALPALTPTSSIRVTFSPRTLTVLLSSAAAALLPPTDPSIAVPPLPDYQTAPLWDSIQPSTSVWTFDREGARAWGLLTLHLDKAHEGTRWSSVFASSSSEADVPETLDPSELAAIRENLEKFTAELDESGPPSSLAMGEIDDEVDSSVGASVQLTWVDTDESAPALDSLFTQLLAIPVPGLDDSSLALVTKHGLDAPLFVLERSSSASAPAWKHTCTFPALAFVLASKRDTRFVLHAGSRAVLAFEAGASSSSTSSSGGSGNLYLYRATPRGAQWGKQAIVRVAGGTAGALLGVVASQDVDGSPLILCLCERELVVLRALL